jgi:hypothetical protein
MGLFDPGTAGYHRHRRAVALTAAALVAGAAGAAAYAAYAAFSAVRHGKGGDAAEQERARG